MRKPGSSHRRLDPSFSTILWLLSSKLTVSRGNREVQQRSHTFDIVFFPLSESIWGSEAEQTQSSFES